MIKNFTFILLFFVGCSIMAQGNIRGTIIDSENNEVPNAHVLLEGTEFHSIADWDGNFTLFGIPEGDYNLIVSYIGFKDFSEAVSVKNDLFTDVTIQLSSGIELSEIVINARLEGQAKALNTQKNQLNITEIIASEQIERFPDANVGDALKRISGINVQYDQGEARFANIRGTAPELNSITINGERVPSAEAEQRFVQLDLIPADVIETIEVSKAITPDMDGDAIGGTINLKTQMAKPGGQLKGTLGSGYSFLTEKPIIKGKLSYANRFLDDRLGLIVNASILDKHVRSDNIEAEWDYTDEENKEETAFTNDFQLRQYELQRLRQSYSATLDYVFNRSHKIYISGMYNWRNDWENRYRLNFTDIEEAEEGGYIAEIRRETKGGIADNKNRRLEDQRMKGLNFGGEHFLNRVALNWNVSMMQASEDRPHERYISMRAKDVAVELDLSDSNYPGVLAVDPSMNDLTSAYELREITEEFQFTEENDFNTRLDAEIPILFGRNSSSIKVGVRTKMKSKTRENSFFEFEPEDEEGFTSTAIQNIQDQTNSNFSPGDYEIGSFIDEEHLGDLDLTTGFESESVLEEYAGNFDAEENVYAGYIMYTQQFSDQFKFIVGGRHEVTNVEYEGKIFDGETLADSDRQKADYSNFMPGLHIKYSPSNWSNIKLAWTNTIARPNYYDLVPYQEINTEDEEIKIGNPNLIATTSSNFDLLAEHYLQRLGIVSGGLFYKNLSDVIAAQTKKDVLFNGTTYNELEQPVNAGDANLYGFEFGLQSRLHFMPGVLKNLTFYANYTFTKSELKDIQLEDREDEALPLVGTPENLFNTSLAFDSKRLDIRVSYSFADAFIEEYDSETFYDRWYDRVGYLDVNADYELNDNWKLYFSLNNILDQPLRYYQGVESRVMQEEYYGVQTKIGLKFNY